MKEFNKTENGQKYYRLAILGLFLVIINNIGIGFLSITGYGGDTQKLILYIATHMLSGAGAVLVGVYTGALVQYNSKKRIELDE